VIRCHVNARWGGGGPGARPPALVGRGLAARPPPGLWSGTYKIKKNPKPPNTPAPPPPPNY
ncbi:hypothetical protein, partial [Enterobacter intestinihominis]